MEDVVEINASENQVKTTNDETLTKNQQTEGQMTQMNHDDDEIKDKENNNPNMEETALNNLQQQRRHDEPSELSFEICE